MKLFVGASWYNNNKVQSVYNLSCVGVNGKHVTVTFDCSIALDEFIPERVLVRTGKSAYEMKEGMSESDAIKLLHDVAEKADIVICYNQFVRNILVLLSEKHKFRRKIEAVPLEKYFLSVTGESKTTDEILASFSVSSKSTERTSLEDCLLLKELDQKMKRSKAVLGK